MTTSAEPAHTPGRPRPRRLAIAAIGAVVVCGAAAATAAWLDDPAQLQQLAGLLRAAGEGVLTLVYGARNETRNQAVVIREALIRAAERQ